MFFIFGKTPAVAVDDTHHTPHTTPHTERRERAGASLTSREERTQRTTSSLKLLDSSILPGRLYQLSSQQAEEEFLGTVISIMKS